MTQTAIETDALIVGAGPCGLFQVFELGLLGVKAHVVDTMRVVGGQCSELYPDKPIYDIPGIPVISAQGLVDNLMEQIKPFDPVFHLGEEVREFKVNPEGDFTVGTELDTVFKTKTLFIAGGVGSFQPRRLRLEGIEKHEGKSLFYRVLNPEDFANKRILILGGGDSALDWTLALAPKAESLTLVHRRDEYRAAPATVESMRQLEQQGQVKTLIGNVEGYSEDGDRVSGVTVSNEQGEHQLDCDCLLVFYGLAPKLGPIAEWGLDSNRKTINVDTERFETSIPGVYAIGDINHYPGKKKLILSGFHEAALAAFAAKERITPGKKARLQYTTTSPLMHKRLGVDGEPLS